MYPPRPWPLPGGPYVSLFNERWICGKCHCKDFTTKYCPTPGDGASAYVGIFDLCRLNCEKLDREHLHKRCTNCGFEFITETASFDNDAYQKEKAARFNPPPPPPPNKCSLCNEPVHEGMSCREAKKSREPHETVR